MTHNLESSIPSFPREALDAGHAEAACGWVSLYSAHIGRTEEEKVECTSCS